MITEPEEKVTTEPAEASEPAAPEATLEEAMVAALDEGVAIPATRELIVADAFTRGWAKTVAEQNAEAQADPE